MALALETIREALKNPKKKKVIAKAIKHENRIQFHAEKYLEASEIAQPLTDFLEWVRSLLPKDKYATFVNLFKFPTSNVQLSTKIFRELERVFDGKNSVLQFQFADSFYKDDWDWYRKKHLKGDNGWRLDAWNAFKTKINSILVVDLPQIQESRYPEPYYYFLDIEQVIDFEIDPKGTIEWIIFKQRENRLAVFDSQDYAVVKLNDKGEILGTPAETYHGLGYCPAQFFWFSPLNSMHNEVKQSALSDQLANLDWLLFYTISKKHLDLYAPYPIYSGYEADCDFENNETGDYCDGGFLRNRNDQFKVFRDGTVEKCPVCAEKKIVGVGSYIEVPVPDKDDHDLRNPISITTVDKASLDYNVKEVERLEQLIYDAVVGKDGTPKTNQSLNEMQVMSNFENRTSVLNHIKVNLEKAQKFVYDTCCRLRYGNAFLSSTISMGTEFYIYSVQDLYNKYEAAKKNGESKSVLDAISDKIIFTEHKNNPDELNRMHILRHLEPYRHYSFPELMDLAKHNYLDEVLFKIKVSFSSLIDRFERENTNILEFGKLLEFDAKINIILDKLKDYVRQETASRQTGEQNTERAGEQTGEQNAERAGEQTVTIGRNATEQL